MPSPATINFTDGDSGYVQKLGVNYTIGTGASVCVISKNSTTGLDKRAVFRFPTAGVIGPDVSISLVEFFNRFNTAQPTPETNSSRSQLGAWCQATLDASNNDWAHSGSTNLGIAMHAEADGTWIDLAAGGADPTTLINLDPTTNSGITDLMFVDQSIAVGTTGKNWNALKSKCQLRVTYADIWNGATQVAVFTSL